MSAEKGMMSLNALTIFNTNHLEFKTQTIGHLLNPSLRGCKHMKPIYIDY